jgi:uncharacterized protein YjaG (DUF416 family)
MTYKSDEIELRYKLAALSKPKQFAYLLLQCERMMPGLVKFGVDTGYSVASYRECLDTAWTLFGGQQPMSEEFEKCLADPPDTEEYDHYLTSAALNAVLSIGLLIAFTSDHNVDHAVEVSGLACDTVALNVQRLDSISPLSLSLDEVTRHPLMQQEVRNQMQEIAYLASMPEDFSQKSMALLKERAKQDSELIAMDDQACV